MFGFSHFPELIALLVVALLIFGPKRLPEIGGAVGKGIREFRKGTSAEAEDGSAAHTDVRLPDTQPSVTSSTADTDVTRAATAPRAAQDTGATDPTLPTGHTGTQ